MSKKKEEENQDSTWSRIITPQEAHRLEDRIKTRKQRSWIVENLFATGQFHSVCGGSGTGKSSWLLPELRKWEKGEDFLGEYKSFPVPWMYISCDRSFDELDQTLCRLGLEDWNIPALCIEELETKYGLIHGQATLEDLIRLYPWAKLFVIEAIGWFAPGSGSAKDGGYTDVLRYWGAKRVEFTSRGLTIIGTTHTAKSRPGESYAGRDKIMGSSGQPAVYSTVITFDFEDPRDARNPGRIVTIYPRNDANRVFRYALDGNGKLILKAELEEEAAEQEKNVYLLLKELEVIEVGTIISHLHLKTLRQKHDISRQHMSRLLKKLCDAGVLKLINANRGDYVLKLKPHIEVQ